MELQKPKAMLENLKTSSELWTLMDCAFVFILAGTVIYVLFYSLNGTSIVESVLLRFGCLLKSRGPLHHGKNPTVQ